MSDISLDLREQIARIDRNQAETSKFAEETRKLTAEAQKLSIEAAKLSAEDRTFYEEALKLRRDRFVAPVVALGALLGGMAGIASLIIQLALRAGGHP